MQRALTNLIYELIAIAITEVETYFSTIFSASRNLHKLLHIFHK